MLDSSSDASDSVGVVVSPSTAAANGSHSMRPRGSAAGPRGGVSESHRADGSSFPYASSSSAAAVHSNNPAGCSVFGSGGGCGGGGDSSATRELKRRLAARAYGSANGSAAHGSAAHGSAAQDSNRSTRLCGRWPWWAALLAIVVFYFKLHFPDVLLIRQGFSFLLPVTPNPHALIVDLLTCSGEVFNKHGILWWLDEGSLLGAIREGDVIRGDSDIDIGTFEYQQHLMPEAIAEIRATCGYYIVTRDECRSIPGFSSFIPKRIVMRILPGYFGPNWFIDVRAYHVDADGAVYDPSFVTDNDTPFVPLKDILPLTPCALRGRAMLCPRDPVATIVDEFGDSWRTPIKGFKTYMLQREATYKLLAKYAQQGDAAAVALAAASATAAGAAAGAAATESAAAATAAATAAASVAPEEKKAAVAAAANGGDK